MQTETNSLGRFDITVIGGGVMGCSTALPLARIGLKVAVFERRGLGLEASGRNAGSLSPMIKKSELVAHAIEGYQMWMSSKEWLGALFVMGGSLCWAAGSLYSRHIKDPPRPRMLVAMQMLSGGSVLAVLAALTGDWARLDIASISGRSWVALGYLILAGALIGYAAYIWLLTVVPPARAGTYAYVNPVVAMLLGWAFAGEPLAFRSLGAAAIILGSVVVLTTEASAKQGEPSSRNRFAVGKEH